MSELNDSVYSQQVFARTGNPLGTSPREFILKYLHFIPWLAISTAAFLLWAYLKIRYADQIYQVQSSLLIKNDQNNSSQSKEQQFDELFMNQQNINLKNEIAILKSRPVLQRVAGDLGLEKFYYNRGNVRSSILYPDEPFILEIFNMADSTKGFDYRMTIVNDNKYFLGENRQPALFGVPVTLDGNKFCLIRNKDVDLHNYGRMDFEFGWSPLSDVVEGMIAALNVEQIDEQATILNLTYQTKNSNLGRNILNMLMAVYDTLIIEDKRQITSATLKFIDARLAELNDTLRGVQGVLRNFMVTNEAFDIEGQSKAYLDKMGESAKLQAESDVKLHIVDWLIDYIGDRKNSYELVPTNLGIDEPALTILVGEYNRMQLEREADLKTIPRANPTITTLEGSLEKVRTDIYQALQNVRHAYTIEATKLNTTNDDLQGHIKSLPGKSMALLNYERQQKILDDLYSLLLQKKLETAISAASTVSNSSVIEPAYGTNVPISPDSKSIYIFNLLLGLALPIGWIAAREVLKDRVTGRPDVEKMTNAPIVGEIGHSTGDQPLVVTKNSRRFISEQFRIVRTNLRYIIGDKEKPVVMVTSSFSGEGKSFVSTNMGAVMALSGKRTVIMEFDIRKPKIVAGLELKRKLGISNYIIGRARFEDLPVKVEGIDGLYVIPCGPIPPNPAELLLEPKLDELMREVREHFEVVIMDTAPVGLVSDAINLGKYADCTMYVIRQEHTFKKQLPLIQDLYVQKKLPSLCLILNDMKLQGGYYGGYYGSYNYYGYGYGESGYFEDEPRGRRRDKKSGTFEGWVNRLFGKS